MKNILKLLIIFISFSPALLAEEVPMNDAIKWQYDLKFDSPTEATVTITAKLYHHFHLFSMLHNPVEYDFSGTATNITFKKSSSYQLVGKVRENKPSRGTDDTGNYIWHTDKAVFTQKIKIIDNKPFNIDFSVEWQICNDVMCHIPQQDNKTIRANPASASSVVGKQDNFLQIAVEKPTNESEINPTNENTTTGIANMVRGTCQIAQEMDSLPISFGVRANKLSKTEFEFIYVIRGDQNWMIPSGKNKDYRAAQIGITKTDGSYSIGKMEYPEAFSFYDSISKRNVYYYADGSEFKQIVTFTSAPKDSLIRGTISFEGISKDEYFETENLLFTYHLKNATFSGDAMSESKSYWYWFGIAFLGGLAALLMPCIFPMIPMTVSFFLKQSKSRAAGIRNAITYSISIIVIYITLGFAITLIFGPSALNAMSTNIYFNIAFFLLLVVFGASFLGAFEIKLPASWINKADAKADKGGLIGIFFMALTLALVSFSCTGPIIGSLLVVMTDDIWLPLIGMFGFSLALALPFGLFAAFPTLLNSMPQSGGWLNVVKVVLGFLEIALAFKFLSNADLVVQAHLLEREVFIAFWIIIFSMLGFYLLGKIKFSHDSEMFFVPVPRLFMGIFVFAFVIYMIPGMWGSPLKILSGFLPPQHYSEIPYGIFGQAPSYKLPKHAYYGPHGIPVFHDYDYAKEYADSIGKPLMLDFTGHACINCRKMEDQVWSVQEVKQQLIDNVVVVSLHVDEKTRIPKEEQTKDENGKFLTSIGDKWSHLQRMKYGQQTQPQYVLLDKDENKLSPSTTYTADGDRIKDFKKWLDNGIEQYDTRKNLISASGGALIKPRTCISIQNPQSYASMYEEVYGEKFQP